MTPLPTVSPGRVGPSPSTVAFIDANAGWLGVEDGILGTKDSGQTWTRELTGPDIRRIWGIDASHAWALAADDRVYRTQDGMQWTALPPTTPPIVELDFVSPLLGWAIAAAPLAQPIGRPQARAGTLLGTIDGGEVWRQITSQSLWSVCLLDPQRGYGANGKTIYRTNDAGRTWLALSTVTINDDGPWYPQLSCADEQNIRVQITEPYAALSHVPYVVFATTDGARSWKMEYVEGYTLGTVIGLPASGLGSYPSLFGTLHDGTTWILTCSPPADAQQFLILDAAGRTITRQAVPFVACARSASFADATHGWAIVTSYAPDRSMNVVVRSTDRARSWSVVYPRG